RLHRRASGCHRAPDRSPQGQGSPAPVHRKRGVRPPALSSHPLPAWTAAGLATLRKTIPRRHSMTFDLAKILQNKREFRQRLAARPIAEKLAMLDALRERALALRPARPASEEGVLREQPPSYRGQGENTE